MLELKTKIVFDPKDITKKHFKQKSWKRVVICETSCDIHEYYAWFLKKRFNLVLNKPLRKAHITIINDKIETEEEKRFYEYGKELFNGKELIFKFKPSEIRTNGEHWWLKVYSDDVANIRTVMGLTPNPYFNLHLTLGHANEKYIAHSEYILETILRYNL